MKRTADEDDVESEAFMKMLMLMKMKKTADDDMEREALMKKLKMMKMKKTADEDDVEREALMKKLKLKMMKKTADDDDVEREALMKKLMSKRLMLMKMKKVASHLRVCGDIILGDDLLTINANSVVNKGYITSKLNLKQCRLLVIILNFSD